LIVVNRDLSTTNEPKGWSTIYNATSALLAITALAMPGCVPANSQSGQPTVAAADTDEDWKVYVSLPTVLTATSIAKLQADIDAKRDYSHTLATLRFEGRDFVVLDIHLGYGVAYKHIGIYAPDDDGRHYLCLFAYSWAAGSLETALDENTGILELSERAYSNLMGQVVLSCNLRTIGTQTSTRTK